MNYRKGFTFGKPFIVIAVLCSLIFTTNSFTLLPQPNVGNERTRISSCLTSSMAPSSSRCQFHKSHRRGSTKSMPKSCFISLPTTLSDNEGVVSDI